MNHFIKGLIEGSASAIVTFPVWLFLLHYAGVKICLSNLSICLP